MLSEGSNIETDVLLKAKIKHNLLINELSDLMNTKLIEAVRCFTNFPFVNRNRMNAQEAVQIIEQLDQKNSYHLIIVRGLDLVHELKNKANLSKKTMPYITNFEHDKEKISAKEIRMLRDIYKIFPKFFMQTPEMKEAFGAIIGKNKVSKEEKIEILYPMLPNISEKPTFKNNGNQIVYTGKFAEEWCIEELLTMFETLNAKDSNYRLAIAGDKFQGTLTKRKDLIIERFKTIPQLNWYGGVSRKKSREIIKASDVGFSYRALSVDNNESVELSTKLLEYGSMGKPILCRETTMHKQLLGENYPLFVNSEKECIEKINRLFTNVELYQQASKQCFEAVQMFTFNNSYKRIRRLLWSFYKEPIKMLVAGHDLKFLNDALKDWKQNPSYEIKVDLWQGHNKHNEAASQKLLNWADIIFCEWGLGNAVWYSRQKKAHQKLIVRLHAQELKTVYPIQYQLAAIDQFIVISPLIYEKFSNEVQIPKEKMTVIYNMVNTQKYELKKDTTADFNLGLVGILPQIKRLDRAIDIIERLIEEDRRYKLFIKGKLPQDLPWMKNRPEELAYYEEQFKRIKTSNLKDNVIFEKHGSNMAQWFQKIGVMLSTSENESFHLAPMEGMASGATPCIIHWDGAETIYPQRFIKENTEEMVEMILDKANSWEKHVLAAYPKEYFDTSIIIEQINQLIFEISAT